MPPEPKPDDVPGPGPDEDDLVRRFRSGDAAAFRTLLERHQSALRARIGASLPPPVRRKVAVSDVLQESCIVALRRREDLEPRGANAFRNWMLGIVDLKSREAVRHHVVAAKRAAGREVTRRERLDTRQYRSSQASPSRIAAANELAARAREAFGRLPADYREVLRLTREEGLDLVQAAERMGRTHDAAKKLCARALRRYRELLDEGMGDDR